MRCRPKQFSSSSFSCCFYMYVFHRTVKYNPDYYVMNMKIIIINSLTILRFDILGARTRVLFVLFCCYMKTVEQKSKYIPKINNRLFTEDVRLCVHHSFLTLQLHLISCITSSYICESVSLYMRRMYNKRYLSRI